MQGSCILLLLVIVGAVQCGRAEPEWHRALLRRGPRAVTPKDLHNAVEKGDETAVKRLVLRKVDVNAVVDSVTPLMLAAIEGNHHIILVLVRAGAVIDAANKNGTTPLMFAAINEHVDAMEELIELGAELEAKDLQGRTALHWAAYLNKDESVQVLLDNGAEISSKDKEGKTPYDLIGKSPDLATGEAVLDPALVEWLAAPDSSAADLFNSVRDEDLVSVQKMITRGADVNAKLQSNGETPIIVAAALGNARIVKDFATRGGDVDAQRDDGRTALMVAAAFGNLDNVKVLLDNGADPDLEDEAGNTAASLICSEKTLNGECPSKAELEKLLMS